MPAIARIEELAPEFAAIRRQFHEHPELSNQEFKTAEKIAECSPVVVTTFPLLPPQKSA